MTTLITGATGFLGQALLKPLAARDDVVAIRRPQNLPRAAAGVTWIPQDLAAPLGTNLPKTVDVVIHLAQSRRYREFPDAALEVFEVNTGSVVRLLEYARSAGARTVVLASSGAVYAPSSSLLREDTPPAPPTLYATCKLAADNAARHYREFYSIQILRYFFIYGPGQRGMFIPGVIDRVRQGVPVTLAKKDGIRVNPLFVDDAVNATLAATEAADSGVYNVAGPKVVTLREIATIVGEQLHMTPQFEPAPAGGDLVADISRMRERLGAPAVEPRVGLTRTIAADVAAAVEPRRHR